MKESATDTAELKKASFFTSKDDSETSPTERKPLIIQSSETETGPPK
jgi:hypothetical protein